MGSYQIVVKSKAPFLKEAACVWIVKKYVPGYANARVILNSVGRVNGVPTIAIADSISEGKNLTILINKYVPDVFKNDLQPLFYYVMNVGSKSEESRFPSFAMSRDDLTAFKKASLYWMAQGAICRYRNRLQALNAMVYMIDLSATAILEYALTRDITNDFGVKELALGRIVQIDFIDNVAQPSYFRKKMMFERGYKIVISRDIFRGIIHLQSARDISLKMNDPRILMAIAKFEHYELWKYIEKSNCLFYDPAVSGTGKETQVDIDDLANILNTLF